MNENGCRALGKLYVHGMGHFHPQNVIDNSFLENLDIGTSAEWISEHIGITSRRTVSPLDYIKHTRNQAPRAAREASELTNAETGRMAAEMALDRAGIEPEAIGLVIAGRYVPLTGIFLRKPAQYRVFWESMRRLLISIQLAQLLVYRFTF